MAGDAHTACDGVGDVSKTRHGRLEASVVKKEVLNIDCVSSLRSSYRYKSGYFH